MWTMRHVRCLLHNPSFRHVHFSPHYCYWFFAIVSGVDGKEADTIELMVESILDVVGSLAAAIGAAEEVV